MKSWGTAAGLVLGILATVPVSGVRFTPHTAALLQDVQARDALLGTPTDKPGKKLKTAFAKAAGQLSLDAVDFDSDLKTAAKAAKVLAKALPGDPGMASLLADLAAGFAADLSWDSAVLRMEVEALAASKQRTSALAALDAADALLAAAGSEASVPRALGMVRSAARRLRGPRGLAIKSLPVFSTIAARHLAPGECFQATTNGTVYFQPDYLVATESGPGDIKFFHFAIETAPGEFAGDFVWITFDTSQPGVPQAVDHPDLVNSPAHIAYGTFNAIPAQDNLVLGTADFGKGELTLSEADLPTGAWAGSFDITFPYGGPASLQGTFRTTGVK